MSKGWKRALRWFGGLALIIAALAVIGYGVHVHRAADRLAASLAELEAADPGWRLEDLLRSQPDVPSIENSVPRITAVATALPLKWLKPAPQKALAVAASNASLDPTQRAALGELLAPVEPFLPAARDLARFPRGRLESSPDALAPSEYRDVARWSVLLTALRFDAWRRADEGDVDGALASARASLNVARAFADEPSLTGLRYRRNLLETGLMTVEKALALGVASDAALAEVARGLDDDERASGLTFALRAERARVYETFREIAAGRLRPGDLARGEGVRTFYAGGWPPEFRWREAVRAAHPDALRLMTGLVEASRLPPWEQPEAEDALARQAKATGPYLEGFLGQFREATAEDRQARSRVAALRALVAVERHRLRHGRWPGKLHDVVPAFLERVPDDPFDGEPLRLARRADGVVVYSVGKDRADDGGDVSRKDVGYRLWDADKRRVP